MRTLTTAFGAIVAAALTVVSIVVAEQATQQPTFRSTVSIISLDVSVFDRNHTPVHGLTATDFTVSEAGVAQPVLTFEAVDIPDPPREGPEWLTRIAPDLATNEPNRRAVVLLLDDFFTRYDPGITNATRRMAQTAVSALGPGDLGGVVFSGSPASGQELTTDKARLLQAVERFIPKGFSEGPLSSTSAEGRVANARSSIVQSGMCVYAECVLETLRNIATSLRAWPGVRKTVLMISPWNGELANSAALQRAIQELQRSNVMVNQLDPRGLTVDAVPRIGLFASATGGEVVQFTNTPWQRVPDVVRDSGSYYLLGIRATGAADGRFHPLVITVARPGVEVVTRTGYFAPEPASVRRTTRPEPTALQRAIAGGLPTGDLPMSVSAVPMILPGRKDPVLVVIAGLDRPGDSSRTEMLDVVATAFTPTWQSSRAAVQKLELAPQSEAPAPGHLDVPLRLDLKPGRYEVRAAMKTSLTERVGSAYTSITIPDFAKAPLSLSGVILGRARWGAAELANPLASLISLTPTTDRLFRAGESVTAYLQIHQGGTRPLVTVRLVTKVVDSADRTIANDAIVTKPSAFGTPRRLEHRFVLPLDRLSAGPYLLTFEASAGSLSARRDVRFAVR